MHFRIKHCTLPRTGTIPGARGHKKQIVPAGTQVFCITYNYTRYYWAAYLTEHQALTCMAGLEATVSGTARRSIDIDTLVAWNFKSAIPTRIVREK